MQRGLAAFPYVFSTSTRRYFGSTDLVGYWPLADEPTVILLADAPFGHFDS